MKEKICEFEITVYNTDIKAIRIPKEQGNIPDCKIIPDELRDNTIEVLIELLRDNRLKTTKEFQILGSHLYSFLLENSIGKAINEALFNPEKSFDLIKVELIFQENQAKRASWPWEYLYCPKSSESGSSGFFLASISKLLLSRRVNINIPIRVIPIPTIELPLKILFVAAGPKQNEDKSIYEKLKVTPIQYEKVLEKLRQLKAESNGRIELYELVETSKPGEDYDVTWKKFSDTVKKIEPHAIHFIGHGECKENQGGNLLFMDGSGTSTVPVTDEDFATLISTIFPVRLVFIQACESALPDPYQAISGVAMNLAHKNVTAVVAMQYRIEQHVAINFAGAFYNALANSETIDKAVQMGRDEIYSDIMELARRSAFGLPVLYLRIPGALIGPEIVKTSIVDGGRNTSISETGQPLKETDITSLKNLELTSDVHRISSSEKKLNKCPWCETISYPNQISCDNCGGDLRCPECKSQVQRKGSRFCSECRNPIRGPLIDISELEKPKMSFLDIMTAKEKSNP